MPRRADQASSRSVRCRNSSRAGPCFAGTVSVLGAGAATVGYARYVEPSMRLVVTTYRPQARWPDDFPLTIAALADFHVGEPVMGLRSHRGDRRPYQCAAARPHRAAWRLHAEHALHHPACAAARGGAGARRAQGTARRLEHPRQSRLVERRRRAAPAPRPASRAPRAGGAPESRCWRTRRSG